MMHDSPDLPDLIQSELAGLAFRRSDIAIAMALEPLPMPDSPFVFLVIDPAAGGPQSDYCFRPVSMLSCRKKSASVLVNDSSAKLSRT